MKRFICVLTNLLLLTVISACDSKVTPTEACEAQFKSTQEAFSRRMEKATAGFATLGGKALQERISQQVEATLTSEKAHFVSSCATAIQEKCSSNDIGAMTQNPPAPISKNCKAAVERWSSEWVVSFNNQLETQIRSYSRIEPRR